MGKPIKIHLGEGYRIKQKGVFNFEKLYKEMHENLMKNEFDIFNEKKYSQKKLDKGEEIIVEWVAEREVTDFLKFKIEVDFLFTKMIPAAKGLVHGNARIIFTASIIPDYEEKWSSSRLKQFFYNIYVNILYKDEIKRYEDKLKEDVDELHKVAKEVLDFHR